MSKELKAASVPLKEVPTVRSLLVNNEARQQLAAVAASHMNPESMMRLMANAIRTTPKLAECEPLSLLGALMTCASIGLQPNTVLGHAYLIPFENKKKKRIEANLVIGYKGFIDLARRSGHVVSIHADVAYESDDFSFEYGSNQHLKHRPMGDRTTPTHAYCYVKLTDGEGFGVLPYEQVLKIRNGSQGYQQALRDLKAGRKWAHDKAPWVAYEHEMAKKTAIRALAKMLPLSIEFATAVNADSGRADFARYAMEGASSSGPSIIDDAIYDIAEGDDGEVMEQDPAPKEEPKAEAQPDQKSEQKSQPDTSKEDPGPESENSDGPTFGEIASEITEAIAEANGDPKALRAVVEKMYKAEIASLPDEIRSDVLQAAIDAGYGSDD